MKFNLLHLLALALSVLALAQGPYDLLQGEPFETTILSMGGLTLASIILWIAASLGGRNERLR